MLVLSRKQGEVVVIGNNIRLTIVSIRGNQVRLGLTAPRDMSIQREEICPKPEDHSHSVVRPTTLEAEP